MHLLNTKQIIVIFTHYYDNDKNTLFIWILALAQSLDSSVIQNVMRIFTQHFLKIKLYSIYFVFLVAYSITNHLQKHT